MDSLQVINGNFVFDEDARALNRAQEAVDKAAAQFEAEKKKLRRQDGTSKYALAEERERIAELLVPVQEAAAQAKLTAEEVRKRCDEEAKVKATDPLFSLTDPAEQSEVTYKTALIEGDAEKLSLSTLAERLEAIAIHGSRVERLLYARFARRRMDDERRRAFDSKSTPEGLGPAMRAVDELEAKNVDPKLQARLKRAEERRNAATSLTMHATKRLNEVDGSDERARRQFAARF